MIMPSGTPTVPAFASLSPRGIKEQQSSGSRPQTPSPTRASPYQAGSKAMGGLTFADLVRWEEGEVTAWLQSLRLGNHSSTFARNDITGAVLLDVDQAALKEMGISSVGDRIRIFTAIKNIKKKCAETEAVHRSQLQHGEIEYLDNDASRAGNGSSAVRRSLSSRPPPLHLAQSAQDMSHSSAHSAASPAQTTYSSQGLGLREARGLTSYGQGRVGSVSSGSGTPNRSPASINKSLAEVDGLGHRKINSIGTPPSAHLLQQQRLQQHQQLINDQKVAGYSKRPSTTAVELARAASISGSPTNTSFQRPSTTDTVLNPTQILNGVPLTPISEGSTTGSLRGQKLNSGYSLGRSGGLNLQASRPLTPGLIMATTPLSAYSTLSNDTSRSAALSLEDVKRRTIKFIGEDGTTSIVPVSDCRDAFDVLARVLRKFGKPAAGNSYTPTAGQSTADEDLSPINEGVGDLWGIFATSGEGQTKYLTDNELLAICHAPQPHDPLRERGLTIRRINKMDDPNKRPTGKRINKLESFFGEKVQASGSGGYLSPPGLDDSLMDNNQVTTAGKKMSRANTSIILTGLGATAGNAIRNTRRESKDGYQKSPPPASSSSMIPKKARNFFGQRPPSELISSHLADYFPSTEKRVLERTARKSIYGRPTTSIRSKRDSTWSYAADPDAAPPLPSKESIDGRLQSRFSTEAPPSILIGMDSSDSNTSSHGDESAEATSRSSFTGRSSVQDWSENTQVANGTSLPVNKTLARPTSIRRTSVESSRSRKSLASQLRMARGISGPDERSVGSLAGKGSGVGGGDRSETASMLTVDEITQEVESRRESMYHGGPGSTAWVVDEDGVPIPTPVSGKRKTASSLAESTRPSSGLSVHDGDSLDIVDDYLDTPSMPEGRGNASASGDDESDQQLRHSRTSRTSSRKSSLAGHSEEDQIKLLSEVDDDEDDLSEGDDDDIEDDDDDDDDDEAGGVYQSAAPGKVPIKWIKGALIGAGSFGNVFLGMNAKDGLLMAVKQVELPASDSHSDQRKKSMLEALEREIELLKTMQHENIVQYLDSYADGTHLNIFLEYVPGGSVVALLRNYGAFEEPLVRKFVKQILHGLNYLHNRDIVHRDIKGANILVDNKSCVKISDFGISKKVESDLLVSARAHRPSLQGSVFWMAPEVVKQTSYTRKADIWSLGCLVVEMISGTHPWANLDQMQALFKIGSHAKPQIPEDISIEAIDFLNKTFELDYTKRPLAEELLLHAFITEEFTVSPANEGSGNGSSAGVPASISGGLGDESTAVVNVSTAKGSKSKAGGGSSSKKVREVVASIEAANEL